MDISTFFEILEQKNKDISFPYDTSKKIGTLSGNGKLYWGTDKEYVVKIVKRFDDKFKKEAVLQHFAGEKDIAPKILQVYRTRKGEGVMVMEVMTQSLTELLNGFKHDYEKVETIAKEVYDLIEKLHSLTIYHNDLHTDNIMLDGHGKLKLIDFGDASEDKNDQEYNSLLNSDFQSFNEALYQILYK